MSLQHTAVITRLHIHSATVWTPTLLLQHHVSTPCLLGFLRTIRDRCVDLSPPSFHILFLCQRALLEEVEQDLYLLLGAS